MKRRQINGGKWQLLLLLCLAVFLLAGCSNTAVASNRVGVEETSYTQGQVMVIAATERNRYQNIYSGSLWSVSADGRGRTFEEKLKDQMGQFLVELTTMNLMAKEREIELDGQEKDKLKNLAEEYYDSLTQQDLDYMGVSLEEIYDLYCQYYRADKLVSELIGEQGQEISDAEAKVIEVRQIVLDTREEAENVYAQVTAEGADFTSIASKNSADGQTLCQMEWKEEMDQLEQAAFALEQDEISPIVEQDQRYYILKCVTAYDQEATAARKVRLMQERRANSFKELYDPFAEEHEVKLTDGIWDQVDFSQGENCTSEDFFQRYRTCFNS